MRVVFQVALVCAVVTLCVASAVFADDTTGVAPQHYTDEEANEMVRKFKENLSGSSESGSISLMGSVNQDSGSCARKTVLFLRSSGYDIHVAESLETLGWTATIDSAASSEPASYFQQFDVVAVMRTSIGPSWTGLIEYAQNGGRIVTEFLGAQAAFDAGIIPFSTGGYINNRGDSTVALNAKGLASPALTDGINNPAAITDAAEGGERLEYLVNAIGYDPNDVYATFTVIPLASSSTIEVGAPFIIAGQVANGSGFYVAGMSDWRDVYNSPPITSEMDHLVMNLFHLACELDSNPEPVDDSCVCEHFVAHTGCATASAATDGKCVCLEFSSAENIDTCDPARSTGESTPCDA
mmetsp:Transcript_17167/g.31075  ORF Transcript_17167/g.31075 Transcript_17167/m.31075 type:complete len:353 (-) Transcript_17167:492-1550(-)|eukprot:CAMPEP_0202503256 /NCGR_PEP_ID=MMETSP1361-20130828/41345_1 /ASSEMBLY_ACC=CAM_ASM_000849 /TAXON_ID=210615 /ORGANISM="Staurosira complex sp., Strain CCMP2646" /LENGTH=352 /DNA_ID=CAMNT_0049136435 /DNA_START=1 /DNA_END=1059 /DNA_ORIENTATION=-